MTDESKGVSRRTLMKGAAWSVPVIAVAAAAPAYAASGEMAELNFYLTAGEVIGLNTSNGSVRSNGVRITAPDGKTIAGATVQITVSYTGALSAFSFLNTPYGVPYEVSQNAGWTVDPIEATQLVFTATSTVPGQEITFPAITWNLDPNVRPENDSIVFTGVATITPGGSYPGGGTLTDLTVDPNGGTGALSGPTDTTWPTA